MHADIGQRDMPRYDSENGIVCQKMGNVLVDLRGTRRMKATRRNLLVLGLPGLIWVTVLVTIALYALWAIAFGSVDPLLFTPVPAWNPLHWGTGSMQTILSQLNPSGGTAWPVFVRTCIYIAVALCGCVLIGYPVAYFAAVRAQRSKALVLALLVMPLLVSYMLRMMAWVGLLSPGGWAESIMVHLGIVSNGFNWLDGRSVTVVLGLIYGWVPYFILPLYASLARFDTRYLEAAADLHANSFQSFLRVTLPLSKQGLMAGTVIVALPMFGDYFTPGLLSGSNSTSMVGTFISDYATTQTGQSLAAAAAVWLVIFLTIMLLPYLRSASRATREVTA